MKDKIKSLIIDSINKLKITLSCLNNVNTIEINHIYFNEKFINNVDISTATEDFTHIKSKNNPVLYWFELNSSNKNHLIREKYINYREPIKKNFSASNYRNTSSYKSKYEPSSTTLYVGKVEKGFWGRLVTHLGYNQSKKTAGMQLFYWYDIALFGELKLNYMEFNPEMKHLIPVLEKELANELKPLIGKY